MTLNIFIDNPVDCQFYVLRFTHVAGYPLGVACMAKLMVQAGGTIAMGKYLI